MKYAVFHVTDPSGCKVTDQTTIDYIEKVAYLWQYLILHKFEKKPFRFIVAEVPLFAQ